MKEIMAFLRANKINQTKEALANNGFPAFNCRKVLGRGKNTISPEVLAVITETGELPVNVIGEHLTEATRLIPKRWFSIFIHDEDVEKVVDVLIKTNQTGNKGDGKIFVLPVDETYRIRDGASGSEACGKGESNG